MVTATTPPATASPVLTYLQHLLVVREGRHRAYHRVGVPHAQRGRRRGRVIPIAHQGVELAAGLLVIVVVVVVKG